MTRPRTISARMKITEVLVIEHRIFISVFDAIERVLPRLTTLAEVQTLANIVEGLLTDHAGTETELAYLAFDHVLQDKGQLDRLHQEHQEIDASLRQIQTAADCAEACRLLETALWASREHFTFEERSVFPLLESALHHETLTGLADAWSQRLAAMQVSS
jgi:hemerythrin-like domain-containing protein